jgi:hypothetical protein
MLSLEKTAVRLFGPGGRLHQISAIQKLGLKPNSCYVAIVLTESKE